MRGDDLLDWLMAQGAKPIPSKERERLRKAWFLCMPHLSFQPLFDFTDYTCFNR